MSERCRCGYEGPDEGHPCHYGGYTCGKPAKRRFYQAHPVALSGHTMKIEVHETWACDAHWNEWRVEET